MYLMKGGSTPYKLRFRKRANEEGAPVWSGSSAGGRGETVRWEDTEAGAADWAGIPYRYAPSNYYYKSSGGIPL